MASHSLSKLFLLANVFTSLASAQLYINPDVYTPSNFYSKFRFVTDNDPTHGYVDYKSQAEAAALGIASQSSGYVTFGADSKNKVLNGTRGRSSVRLEGLATYNHGLIIADISHMPGPACGAWPAFWTYGDNWPLNGEIDIIESINSMSSNLYSVHSAGPENTCIIDSQKQTGSLTNRDCGTYTSTGTLTPQGCNINAGTRGNVGSSFNSNGGGVYAVQWTSNFLKIWFFPRSRIPASIQKPNASPDICEFGTPDASFHGCAWDNYIKSQRLVFTNTFCGDYVGGNYPGPGGKCKLSCVDEVRLNPKNYAQSYWQVRGIKVWQENPAVPNHDTTSCGVNKQASGIEKPVKQSETKQQTSKKDSKKDEAKSDSENKGKYFISIHSKRHHKKH